MPEEDELVDEEGESFDAQRAKNYILYVVGSARRRWRSIVLVFCVIFGGTIAGLKTFPKTYHVEAKLLAQRNAVLSIRGDNGGADAPTQAAAETILRRDILVALVRQTDLVRNFAQHRAPAQRAKDAIMKVFQREPPSEEDQLDAMVGLLEKRFNVWSKDGTVTIVIDWPNAQMAYHLVDDAQQSFLEARHVQEIASVADALGILQGHAAALRGDIDTAVEAIKKLHDTQTPAPTGNEAAQRPARSAPASTGPAPPPERVNSPDPQLAKLRVMIDAKQRAIDDLEEFRRRRLSELQARLAEQQAVYTEAHPVIVDLQQTIASLSTESPQVSNLRKDVSELQAEYDRIAVPEHKATAGEAVPGASTSASPRPRPAANLEAPPQLPNEIVSLDARSSSEERDPAMVYARGQLHDAMDKYSALRAQIQTAQIDLETAEAAFKYRYSVVTPPQVPKSPSKPNALVILMAGFFGGLFVGILAAVVSDVLSGRLVERWQVETLLDKPILGEVNVRALPPGPEE